MENESLCKSWENLKDLLRRFPHHDLPIWLQIQTFYKGAGVTNNSMLDATVGGALMSKMAEATYTKLEELHALNNYQWSMARTMTKPVAGVLELDPISSIAS